MSPILRVMLETRWARSGQPTNQKIRQVGKRSPAHGGVLWWKPMSVLVISEWFHTSSKTYWGNKINTFVQAENNWAWSVNRLNHLYNIKKVKLGVWTNGRWRRERLLIFKMGGALICTWVERKVSFHVHDLLSAMTGKQIEGNRIGSRESKRAR